MLFGQTPAELDAWAYACFPGTWVKKMDKTGFSLARKHASNSFSG